MPTPERKDLSALDATLLVMGGIIGIGIFFNPASIAERAADPRAFLAVWVLGGMIAMCAAFTFAELGASFPRTGGWFVYLKEAFGPYPAFLFAWVVLGVVTTGAIAAVAQFCAGQLQGLLPAVDGWLRALLPGSSELEQLSSQRILASCVVVLTTAVALSGVKRAAVIQNLCMLIKLLAIAALVAMGLFWSTVPNAPASLPTLVQASSEAPDPIWLGMLKALLPVFFAFGGWQMVAYIAPEVRDPKRTLPRAILWGVLGVIVVYVSVNFAYLHALGIEGLAGNPNFAATLAERALGPSGGRWLSIGMVVSAGGWVMVTILTAPWLYVAMAREGLFFQGLGKLHPTRGVPSTALFLQSGIALCYVWAGSINFLVDAVVSIEWIFHGMVAIALLQLRRTRPELERPYRSPLYPLAPVIYAIAAATVVISTVLTEHASTKLALSAGLLLAGSLTFVLWKRAHRP